jgi:hypothetical protein
VNRRDNAGRQPALANGVQIVLEIRKIDVNVRIDRFHGASTNGNSFGRNPCTANQPSGPARLQAQGQTVRTGLDPNGLPKKL